VCHLTQWPTSGGDATRRRCRIRATDARWAGIPRSGGLMRLIVTRPEPDATAMRTALEAAGHAVSVEPLMRVVPVEGPPIALSGVQAIVATSRNALRMVGDRLDMPAAANLPLVAVGKGTAALAKEAGFQEVIEGPAGGGDLPSL